MIIIDWIKYQDFLEKAALEMEKGNELTARKYIDAAEEIEKMIKERN